MSPFDGIAYEDIDVRDWRSLQSNPPGLVRGKRKHKLDPRTGLVLERDPRTIDAIVFHQTACSFGPVDNPTKRYRRALGVACHALAFRDGVGVLANPLRWQVNHGNGFNARSLGLEVEGLYAGLEDDPHTIPDEAKNTTWGGHPDDLTALCIATARRMTRELYELAAEEGIVIRYALAHRQSSGTRRSDPGQAIWASVVEGYAVRELGLSTLPGLALASKTSGNGRPVPHSWSPKTGVGRY